MNLDFDTFKKPLENPVVAWIERAFAFACFGVGYYENNISINYLI